jgi:hypothetical protein
MKHDDHYMEAMRYIENAEEILKTAGNDGRYYDEEKYVKITCSLLVIKALKPYSKNGGN